MDWNAHFPWLLLSYQIAHPISLWNLWCEERIVQGQPFQWRPQGQVDIPIDDVTPKKTPTTNVGNIINGNKPYIIGFTYPIIK
jgi:hypothetical protein